METVVFVNPGNTENAEILIRTVRQRLSMGLTEEDIASDEAINAVWGADMVFFATAAAKILDSDAGTDKIS